MSIEGQCHFFTIYFPGFVCFVLYKATISGERLQDHWSSGVSFFTHLLAHLSRRLIGELIVYPWSGVGRRPASVRRPSVRRSQCSNIFFSETAWPIKAKFYVEPPWVGGTKFCSRHLGHMTKMAATPIYGKNHSKIFSSRTGRPISTKLGMYHRRLQPIIFCSNDDPGVTLTYFTARSNLLTWAFL